MNAALVIPELGQLAMILAICFAAVQATVPLLGAPVAGAADAGKNSSVTLPPLAPTSNVFVTVSAAGAGAAAAEVPASPIPAALGPPRPNASHRSMARAPLMLF